MRPIVFGVCVLMAACGHVSNSPASPLPGSPSPAQTQAQNATNLPFRGDLTTNTLTPPPNAVVTFEGTATSLGRFTGRLTASVDLATGQGIGNLEFTAADGDRLLATFVGQGEFIPPNTGRLTEVATITGGTGRYAGATGTFTVVRTDIIDLSTFLATGYGSFAGHISLRN
jgi:hypothetical protein